MNAGAFKAASCREVYGPRPTCRAHFGGLMERIPSDTGLQGEGVHEKQSAPDLCPLWHAKEEGGWGIRDCPIPRMGTIS